MRIKQLRRTQVSEELRSEKMSVRSINLCKYNDLYDLQALLVHFRKFGSFLNLRNCGLKSNDELVSICLKSILSEEVKSELGTHQEDLEIINYGYFNEVNLKILDAFIIEHLDFLSNRSYNALSAFLHGDFSFLNLHLKILSDNKFNFRNIRNVGSKSLFELEKFTETLRDFVLNLRIEILEVDLTSIQEKYFFPKTFLGSKIPNEIVDSKSVFKLVDFLIRNNNIFQPKENVIFQGSCKIFNDQGYSSDVELSVKLNISRERVRQLRKQILTNIESKFDFVKGIVDTVLERFDLDLNRNLIVVDESLSNDLNRVNGTNFTVEFNAVLLSILHQSRLRILGDVGHILASKRRAINSQDFVRNLYLIDHSFYDFFNFHDMCHDIHNRLSEKIVESYSFHFSAYLSGFSKKSDSAFITEIKPIAEQIISLEYDLFLDCDDRIIFEKSSVKNLSDSVVDTLGKIGVPSRLDVIFNKLHFFYPNVISSQESLRSIIHRTPEIICISRSGTYGLKTWEAEERGIKGGTIRRMVVELLSVNLEPVHISKIASYVLQFRPNSNEKSIYYNLKMDESNTFAFFQDSNVGLIGRNYDSRYQFLSGTHTRNSGINLEELVEFINEKKRMPDSRETTEAKLYRFYYRKKKNLEQVDSISAQEARLLGLIEKYGNAKHTKYSIDELVEFVRINKRMPDSRKDKEKGLYQFAYKQRRMFEKGEIDECELNKFVEIADIIKNKNNENKRN
jgi:hypothetical protein